MATCTTSLPTSKHACQVSLPEQYSAQCHHRVYLIGPDSSEPSIARTKPSKHFADGRKCVLLHSSLPSLVPTSPVHVDQRMQGLELLAWRMLGLLHPCFYTPEGSIYSKHPCFYTPEGSRATIVGVPRTQEQARRQINPVRRVPRILVFFLPRRSNDNHGRGDSKQALKATVIMSILSSRIPSNYLCIHSALLHSFSTN